ncbi:MAG: hypothetical protein CMD53_01840 [Gammaproteobacteria bacterium]|jgi:hypothetical protein|nr:hypothetical protein [Gammaproteobacteria bacterium]HJL96050.1 hypothetical protein [SAR86 cluster bacterium]|tara:strand:- start:3098 stop:3280 length:183 start_codon:yes stop_codon:yes gene_type:complete
MVKLSKEDLKLRLISTKQKLSKIEDEHGLNFWTGRKENVDKLKAEIYDLEEMLSNYDVTS